MKITGCLLTCLALSLASIVNADAVRTVVLTGDAPPDINGESARFASLYEYTLNAKGQVAFAGFFTGSDRTSIFNLNGNGSGIWSEGSGSITLVARTGDKAPGTDASFRNLGKITLSDGGRIAFEGSLFGPGIFVSHGHLGESRSNKFGIWSERNGSLTLIARSDNEAPNTGDVFRGFAESTLNSDGQIAIGGLLPNSYSRGPVPRGIWSEEKGLLALVALEGKEAPDTSATFSTLDSFVFNGAGQTAFSGILNGSGVNPSNDRGIWSEGNGSLALIARTGTESPVMGADFSILNDPVLNDASHIAFRGQITGSGVSQSNDKGIWSDRSGPLGLVVRGGTNAPGTGARFFDFDSPVLNGDDKTAFLAILAGPGVNSSNNDGIWSEGGGSLALVAREGSVAPGTEETFFRLDPPSLNGAGQVAFSGYLSSENVNDDNNFGIWAEDLSGGLRLIAREGDQLDVDDGPGSDSRTISRLLFGLLDGSGNEDGRPSFFNDRGQLVFRATFTDGTSGIFVSNLVAIPEPGALVLLGVGSVGLLLGRVRRNRKP